MDNKLLDKFVKKDYKNTLENILVKKNFSKEVKNSLLSMFYKIENGYKDFNTVKKDTFSKKEYIEKIIKIIEEDCKKIEFISTSDDKKKELVKDGEIYCYPIETKILYSLAKIQKQNIVINFIDENIEEAFTYVLNIGNNINMVEPLRDFNGFSWNVIKNEIDNLGCNIIYQNILFLAGNKFVDNWVNNYDPSVDYFKLFQNNLEEKYGNVNKENIIDNLLKVSILEYALSNKEFKEKIYEQKEKIKEENLKLQNTEEYVIQITKEKKEKNKQIKLIDKILNNKELLEEEYRKRNAKLPLEKKIFSIRILKNIIKKEKEELIQEIGECNKKMSPKVFLERREKTKQELQYIDIGKAENLEKEAYKKIVDLQKEIIKCMYMDLKKINEKNELINIMYMYRYYNLLPISEKECIYNITKLNTSLNKFTKCMTRKFIELNIMKKIFNNEELNYNIMQKIVLSKIICLEEVNIKVAKQRNEIYLIIYDEEIEEYRIKLENITQNEINIKINKKVKLFKV